MRLEFQGHDYKYAAEQMMLTLFPEERPQYAPLVEGENGVRLTLEEADGVLLAQAEQKPILGICLGMRWCGTGRASGF